mgnify:CR=1 FL=1
MNLKPCPFCGGDAKAVTDAYRERFINEIIGRIIEPAARNAWIFCTVCGARGKAVNDPDYDGFKNTERENRMIEKAAAAWNDRAEEGETR